MFCAVLSVSGVWAQQEVETQKPMKVEVKEQNGETILTITMEENGQPVEQVYTGEAAKEKLAEIQGEIKDEGKQIEIEITEVDGVKHLKVITKENGEETVEEFVGEAADAKLKELEGEAPKKDKRAEDFNLKSGNTNVREKSSY